MNLFTSVFPVVALRCSMPAMLSVGQARAKIYVGSGYHIVDLPKGNCYCTCDPLSFQLAVFWGILKGVILEPLVTAGLPRMEDSFPCH